MNSWPSYRDDLRELENNEHYIEDYKIYNERKFPNKSSRYKADLAEFKKWREYEREVVGKE